MNEFSLFFERRLRMYKSHEISIPTNIYSCLREQLKKHWNGAQSTLMGYAEIQKLFPGLRFRVYERVGRVGITNLS